MTGERKMVKTQIIKVISIISILFFTTSAYARQISYSYVQGVYASLTDSSLGTDVNGTGIELAGSFAVAKNIAVTAGYVNESYDRIFGIKVTGNGFTAGITAHTSIAPNVDVYGNFSAIHEETKVDNGITSTTNSDTGNAISVGVRGMVNNQFELGLSATRTDIYSTTTNSYALDALFYVNEKVAIGAGYQSSDNFHAYLLGVHYDLK